MTRQTSRRFAADRGFTLIELLISLAIIAVIAAIAIPGLLRARVRANEGSAVASLKAVVSAQTSYFASCGQGRYATALPTLGLPSSPGIEPFLSKDLAGSASPQKTGYILSLALGAGAAVTANDCNGQPTASAYYGTAIPVALYWTGTHSFATNTAGLIWQQDGIVAPTEPFGTPAVPIQ